jgi:hypothetical protein
MKRDGFQYDVKAVLTFSKDEINALLKVSARHYDHTCRKIGRPGHGSFLWGMRMRMMIHDTSVTLPLTFSEIDLLCKITEMCAYHSEAVRKVVAPLWYQLHRELKAINEESEHLNQYAA